MVLSAGSFTTIANGSTDQVTGSCKLSYQFLLYDKSYGTTILVDNSKLPYFLVNLTWTTPTGTIYSLTNVDGRGNYSYVTNLTQNTSIRAMGDNENIILTAKPLLRSIPNDMGAKPPVKNDDDNKVPVKNDSNNLYASATMKNTGIPIIALILLLLTIIGLGVSRKQN